jgi:hypothetical protein
VARGGADIGTFLALVGTDPRNPVLLEVRQNSDVAAEPMWGEYGTNKKFEIVHASPPQVAPDYSLGNRRAGRGIFTSTLRVKPFSHGNETILTRATGGILEDVLGWKDNLSRGLKIPEANENLHVNPVFGNSTYNTSWTDGANVTDSENRDEGFVLFGDSSVKLVASGGTAAGRSYTQSIDLSAIAFILSYYVKLPDSSAVSSTHCQVIYNGSTETTTYTAIGDDGWYRISASITGAAAAADCGLTVSDGYTIYMDAAQLEQNSYITPFCYGDLLGNSWSGTAHGGTIGAVQDTTTDKSTRTVARVRLDVANSVSVAEGTIRVVWKPDKANTDFDAASKRLFEEDTGEVAGYFDGSNEEFKFTDGTNTVTNGAATTFSAGDVIILHFVWSPGSGLTIYKEGTSYGTNATYTPPTLGTYLYIGSTDGVIHHSGGTFMDFATYDKALTAAEVLADYNNINELTSDNQRVGSIPYIWTVDGDEQVDNTNASGSGKYAYCVVGGIPGTEPAKTRLETTLGQSISATKDVYFSLLDLPEGDFIDVETLLYDAGNTTSVTTNPTADDPIDHLNLRWLFSGREYIRLTTITDTDGDNDLRMANIFYPGGLTSAYAAFIGEFVAKAANTTAAMFKTGGIVGNSPLESFPLTNRNVRSATYMKRDSGTNNVTTTSSRVFFEPLFWATTPGSISNPELVYEEGEGYWEDTNIIQVQAEIIGSVIRLLPNRTNIIQNFIGQEGQAYTSTDTITYTRVFVTPRYALL